MSKMAKKGSIKANLNLLVSPPNSPLLQLLFLSLTKQARMQLSFFPCLFFFAEEADQRLPQNFPRLRIQRTLQKHHGLPLPAPPEPRRPGRVPAEHRGSVPLRHRTHGGGSGGLHAVIGRCHAEGQPSVVVDDARL